MENNIKKIINKIPNNQKKEKGLVSFKVIQEIDKIILEYKENINDSRDRLLSIFGLFQSLFVGIDAMYDLSYVFKDKNFININRNKTLRDLKFIRNDIVGHPTNRVYEDNSIGFCSLNLEKTTKKNIFYTLITFQNQNVLREEKEFDILNIINEYMREKNLFISELANISNLSKNSNIKSLLYQFSNDRNLINLEKLTEAITKNYNLIHNNRYLWRCNLIKKLLQFDFESFSTSNVNYFINFQISKLFRMIFNDNIFTFQIPENINHIKSELIIDENTKRIILDITHPLFHKTILSISSNIKTEESKNFFSTILNIKDEEVLFSVLSSIIK
ncbi:MAG: hypothetical protein LBV58_04925 [Acholeplasmatales bacterium]|jgi:hypothetical protein|nr:hypothetical protein [Acholeplasmatales bacterium]